MRTLKALDLFCCAGGAAMGLHQAGFSVIGVYGGGQHPGRRYHLDEDGNLITPHKQYPATIGVYGNCGGSSNRDGIQMFGTQDRRDAMGIQWMTGKELSKAIPPAYAKHVADQFLQGVITNERKRNAITNGEPRSGSAVTGRYDTLGRGR